MKLLEIKNFTVLKESIGEDKFNQMSIAEKYDAYKQRLAFESIIVKDKKEEVNKKRINLKKIAKSVIVGLVGTVVTASVGLAVLTQTNKLQVVNTNLYKTQEQIQVDADAFKTDMRYAYNLSRQIPVTRNPIRLRHNNNNPIWVYINDEVTEVNRESIKKTLQLVEDVFKDINNKYRFQIVSESQRDFYNFLNHTTLEFDDYKTKKSSEIGILNKLVLTSTNSNSSFIKSAVIGLNQESIEKSPTLRDYTVLHELLHAFGLGDTYPTVTSTYANNTFLEYSPLSQSLNQIYENDYRVLNTLYNVNHLSGGKVNIFERNKIIENINNYEKEFYNNVTNFYMNKSIYNTGAPINMEEIKNNSLNYLDTSVYGKFAYQVKLTFDDNNYIYTIRDFDGNILDQTVGDYFYTDNYIVLKNVEYNNSYKHELPGYNNAVVNKIITLSKEKNDEMHQFELSSLYRVATKPFSVKEKEFEYKNVYDLQSLKDSIFGQELTR